MKKALILVVVLSVVFIGGIFIFDDNARYQDKKPYIAVTSFALYDIVNTIVADRIEVKKLVPFGIETHTYTPSVKTMSELLDAKLFMYNGLGMEPWLKNKYANGLDMSTFVHLLKEDTHHEDEHGHMHNGAEDPHYWLDTENMILMTQAAALKLEECFPEYKAEFEKKADAYIEALNNLDREYTAALKNCRRKEIVVNHNAFAYLGQRYGFSSHSVTGLSPDEQVSAKKMKEIVDLVKEEDIKVIFFESFVSPKVSEAIAKESGVRTESLQPLANVREDEAGKGYISLMRENLQKLMLAMECE